MDGKKCCSGTPQLDAMVTRKPAYECVCGPTGRVRDGSASETACASGQKVTTHELGLRGFTQGRCGFTRSFFIYVFGDKRCVTREGI